MDIAALGDVDTVAITLKFPSNVIGVIDASRHASYGYDQRIEVGGFFFELIWFFLCFVYLFAVYGTTCQSLDVQQTSSKIV